ncbi:MAG: ABC transporter permease [Vicinamibacteria bacterium]
MTALRVLVSRLCDLVRGGRREDELKEEIEAHLDLLVEEHIRRGMSVADAREAARRDFGGVQQVMEAYRDQRALPFWNGLRHDLRFAARLLVKDRGFALIAVITLALGIAANSTVFTFVNAATLRGLPVPDPERILKIYAADPSARPTPISYEDFLRLREATRSFIGISAYRRSASTLIDEALAPEQYQSLYISAEGFGLLGVRPVLGRDFLPEDDRPGAPSVAILGEALWKRRYGGEPGIVGRTIQVDGVPTVVIGVMPEGFEFDYFAELWQPLGLLPSLADERRSEPVLGAVGKLRDGVTLAQARAVLASFDARPAEDGSGRRRSFRLTAVPFTGSLSSDPVMPALLGAVGFVLLIGCANVANLLMARAATRSRELSIRVSVGATRYRILRQLLVESALLASLAGVVGLGLSRFGVRLFASAVEDIAKPYWIHWTMDGRVFTFVAAVSIATACSSGSRPPFTSRGRTSRL